MKNWVNEFGDILNAKDREDWIEEEIACVQDAYGKGDPEATRRYAERSFARDHKEIDV